jgi:DNA-directed RNA polymerase subunit omega
VRVPVAATTRPRRAGEVDGVDYAFLDRPAFERMIAGGELLEWTEVAGHLYGTPGAAVRGWLAAGEAVLVPIDPRGAELVRAAVPRARVVCLVPPDHAPCAGSGQLTVVNDSAVRAADELVSLLGSSSMTPADRHRAVGGPDHRRFDSVAVANPEGITNPPIDELLEKTSSKYALVIFAAKRARQVNAYYSQLGEGLLEYVGPLVETTPQEKPLSIAMREINAGLLTAEPTDQP